MRHWIGLVCLVLMLAISTAHADMPPTPDRGPPKGSASGLDFAIQWIDYEVKPPGWMHGFYKSRAVAVLVRCTEGRPNCKLGQSRNLIGLEVLTVDGQDLRPEKGMVRQIIDAFGSKTAAPTVTLKFNSRDSNGEPIKVTFARQ